ncbi:MAG TPA: hypothetical protein VNN19_02965 [bacterium]|nr:hypothetical protein [bacterium]
MKLERVDCRREAQRATARVELSLDDDVRSGLATAPGSGTAWQHAVAEATLHAVSAFVGSAFTFTLDSVAEVRAGRHPLIVVTIVMRDGRREVFFPGTAQIGDHPPAAVARAVLNGLNRWAEPLLEREIRPAPPASQSGQMVH